MSQTHKTKAGYVAAISAGVAMAFSAAGVAQELPATMTWSSYDVGSAGYAEASAMADAMGKEYGTKVRIQPSGSSIGRLQPVLQKRADVGFLATEAFLLPKALKISPKSAGVPKIFAC